MPTGSRPVQALRTAREIGCETAQVFLTNPRAWRAPGPDPIAEEAFRRAAEENALAPIVVHATYLINLAAPRDDIYENSVTLLRATLERAARYGASSVVFHIGSHVGAGEEAGIERLTSGIRRVLDGTPESVLLLLENDTGGGGKLGYRFENLATVLDLLSEHRDRLGVCLDTAHLWGAGFDIGTAEGAAATLADADRILGLRRVPVLHLNDTPKGLGSHLDNHARLGEGVIPAEGMRALLRSPLLGHTSAILETPIAEVKPGEPDWDADRAHLHLAKRMAGLAPEAEEAAPAPDPRLPHPLPASPVRRRGGTTSVGRVAGSPSLRGGKGQGG